jgi:hypothetical protein
MGLSDLHEEGFKHFAMEYNTTNDEPDNKLDHYLKTLQRSNEYYDPGINDMFIDNLDPTFYAMQMQNHRRTKTRNKRINGHKHFRIHSQHQITSYNQISRPDPDIQMKTPSRRISKEIQSSTVH